MTHPYESRLPDRRVPVAFGSAVVARVGLGLIASALGCLVPAGTAHAHHKPWHGADTQKPTITASNKVAECVHPAVPVHIKPTVTDDKDASPTVTFSNGLNNTDPDNYPFGARLVQINACDDSDNCTQASVVVDVRDTTAPSLSVPANVFVECTSTAGTPGGVTAASFVATDGCDPAPTVQHNLPAGGTFPFGPSVVNVSAIDASGNTTNKSFTVTVRDTTAPTLISVPSDFALLSASGECTVEAGGDGTLVTIPAPTASDACTGSGGFTFTWAAAGVFGETTDNQVCLPDGDTVVDLTAYDAAGRASTAQITVSVVSPGDFTLNVGVTAPGTFQNTSVNVIATVSSGDPAAMWSSAPASSASSVDGAGTLTASFTDEGIYCPTHLTVIDSSFAQGAGVACFGIDLTPASLTYMGVATTWPAGDPTLPQPVDPGDSTTWPVYNTGDRVNLQVSATDPGAQPSGIARITAVLDPAGAAITVLDHNPLCPSTPDGLAVCPATAQVLGCNQAVAACGSDGKVSFASLGTGAHTLRLQVTDGAGNTFSRDYGFMVGSFAISLALESAWVQSLLASSSTPSSALTALLQARDLLATGQRVFYDSPGHAFLLAQKVWSLLADARDRGADTDLMLAHLSRSMVSEVARILGRTAAAGHTDWTRRETSGETPPTQDYAFDRTFLVDSGLHTVNGTSAFQLATAELASASAALSEGVDVDAMREAMDAFDALVMHYDDTLYAALYGAEINAASLPARPYEVESGVVERYHRGSPPAHFGDYVARTVSNQIGRFAADAADGRYPGIPSAAVTTMLGVRDSVAEFATAVQLIKSSNWNLAGAGFNNERLVREVYLTAEIALEQLQTIQSSSVYTHYWQAGLALTLAYVINFSVYEGPTSLYNRFSLSSSPLFESAQMFTNAGNFPSGGQGVMDVGAQVAECRYHKVLYALSDGRVTDAVNDYLASKCLIVDVYNRLYGEGQVPGLGDGPIDPADYGCSTTLGPLDLQVECPCAGDAVGGSDDNCNGIDDNCDGQVDEGYQATTCGVGLCAGGVSACVGGVEQSCTPLAPPSNVDVTCDGVDDDCSGEPDEDWVSYTCGVGACQRSATCEGGVEYCVPGDPIPEICDDGIDNDCDFAIDEGCNTCVDADGDGFFVGCTEYVLFPGPDCDDGDNTVWVESTFYRDADVDTFGDPNTPVLACGQPSGYVPDDTDCDDTDSEVFTDGTYYRDQDGDGHGDLNVSVAACGAPSGYVADSSDCNDDNPAVFNNCNGLPPYVLGVSSAGLNTIDLTFSEPVSGGTVLANYSLVEEPVESGCLGSGDNNIALTGVTQINPTTYRFTNSGQQCSTTTYKLSASGITDADDGLPLVDPTYGTFLGNEQLKVVNVTCLTDTTLRVTFSKPVKTGSGNGGAESASRYRLTGPTSLGTITSVVLNGDRDQAVITHSLAQSGATYTLVASNGIDGDGFDDETVGSIEVFGSSEAMQETPGDRVLWQGCGTAVVGFAGGPLLSDPFGDGSDFGYLTSFGGQVYIGPNKLGSSAARFNPDGTNPSTVTFTFAYDGSNSAGGKHRNTGSLNGALTYTTLGHTGCTQNIISTTYGCGPDNEDGRGYFFTGTLGSTKHLFIGGVRSTPACPAYSETTCPNFDYVYYTRDTDAKLDFAYLDMGEITGYNTNGLCNGVVMAGRFYPGYARAGDNRPDLGKINFSGSGSCTATNNCDIDQNAEGIRLNIQYMPYFGGMASTSNRNWAFFAGAEAMTVFNDRLYIANGGHNQLNHNGSIIRSTNNNPGACSGTGSCSNWTEIGPRTHTHWHGSSNNRWSLELTKAFDLTPADRAFAAFAEYKGRLFLTRTTCRTSAQGSARDASEHTIAGCNDGNVNNREAQLWMCVPGSNLTCEANEWSLVADNGTGITNFGVTDNRTMTLLQANGDYLYVGFDNPNGVHVYRTNVAAPTSNSAQWEQVGTAGFGDPTQIKHLFSSLSIQQGTQHYIYVAAGKAGVPVAIYRQANP